MPWKGTVGLGAESEASKVHIWLLGGPILSDLKVSYPQKPNGDAPDSVSWLRPKTPKKGTMAWKGTVELGTGSEASKVHI